MYDQVTTILILLAPLTIFSQKFEKAPDVGKPVRQIIEWSVLSGSEQVLEKNQKHGVYNFREDGKLESWQTFDFIRQEQKFTYDSKGRLIKVIQSGREDWIKTTFTYQHARTIKEVEEYLSSRRVIYFTDNDDQLVEEKYFLKSEITGGHRWMTRRRFFEYNEAGNLINVLEYVYKNGKKVGEEAVTHTYDEEGRLIKSEDLDMNELPEKVTEYTYDGSGHLMAKTITGMGPEPIERTEYIWKDGHVAKEIHKAGNRRTVDIYEEGQLVGCKIYLDGHKVKTLKYQYVFW